LKKTKNKADRRRNWKKIGREKQTFKGTKGCLHIAGVYIRKYDNVKKVREKEEKSRIKRKRQDKVKIENKKSKTNVKRGE
jgi:hypothetical protein